MNKRWDALLPEQKLEKIINNAYFKNSLEDHKVCLINKHIVLDNLKGLLENISLPKKSQYINLVACFVISPLSNITQSFNYIMNINGRFKGELHDRWSLMYGEEYANDKLINLKLKLKDRKVIRGEEKKDSTHFCKQYWVKHGYSEIDAIEKIKEVQSNNSKRRDISTYRNMENYSNRSEYWIKRGYSNIDATEKVNEQIKKQASNLTGLVYRHGQELGQELYEKRIEKFKASMRNADGSWKGTCYTSKESLRFFIPIYKYLRRRGIKKSDIYWGISGSNEYYINKGNGDIFRYDFTIPKLNVIIEYHGIAWHPLSIKDDGVFRYIGEYFNRHRAATYYKDRYKEQFARDKGFKIFPIWSIESNMLEKTLNFVKENFNE